MDVEHTELKIIVVIILIMLSSLPSLYQAKVIKPPLLPGEVLLLEQGLHAYLLCDGRENGLLVPADGHVFLTSYRVIFLGTPCDAQKKEKNSNTYYSCM